MIRRPPRSTHCISSAASDVYKRQNMTRHLLLSWKTASNGTLSTEHWRPIHATKMSMIFSTLATCRIQLKTLLGSMKSRSIFTRYSNESYKWMREKSLSVLTMPIATRNRSTKSSSKSWRSLQRQWWIRVNYCRILLLPRSLMALGEVLPKHLCWIGSTSYVCSMNWLSW